ncbi:MAG TPA: protein-L-isoaspartate O-methyltransferase [Jiangellaceae bacterium]|nr:protein-L-isoaspartate O-methyltransferase [Jiangellaceae bacterium]
MRPVHDRRVRAAFDAVPRTDFLPPEARQFADEDRPIAIGSGQTNSQPSTVAAMLELLEVQPGDRVLDVGAGSGWTTALLAHLVGSEGQVIGVELVPELARTGAENVRAAGMDWARIEQADPTNRGWPAEAPYDRVLVSAETPDLPRDLAAQVRTDGLMVVPVGGRMLVVRPRDDGDLDINTHGAYSFVPLH